jgi:hypothetical protein
VETMNENCAYDSENTLVQFLIEVCHVLQHQYTNQCTFSRVAAAVAIITSSSSIAGIAGFMQLCMNIINYNLFLLL